MSDDIARAIIQIAQRVDLETRRKVTTCECGCLIRVGESCPACALAAVGRAA